MFSKKNKLYDLNEELIKELRSRYEFIESLMHENRMLHATKAVMAEQIARLRAENVEDRRKEILLTGEHRKLTARQGIIDDIMSLCAVSRETCEDLSERIRNL